MVLASANARGQPQFKGGLGHAASSSANVCLVTQGNTLTKEMFLNHLYGGMDKPKMKIIDVFVCKMREKLAVACGGDNYIETVWGRGYVLRDPEEQALAALQSSLSVTGALPSKLGALG